MNYFDSDMSNSTNTVVYFDWKAVICIYVCGQCRTSHIIHDAKFELKIIFTTGVSRVDEASVAIMF